MLMPFIKLLPAFHVNSRCARLHFHSWETVLVDDEAHESSYAIKVI